MANKTLTPQEQGREYERYLAKFLGGKLTPGSGNKWYARLDLGTKNIIWSAKFTTKKSFSLTKDMLREAEGAANGPGGEGGAAIPAMSVRVEGQDYAVMRLEDLRDLLVNKELIFEQSKKEKKKGAAKVPRLLR